MRTLLLLLLALASVSIAAVCPGTGAAVYPTGACSQQSASQCIHKYVLVTPTNTYACRVDTDTNQCVQAELCTPMCNGTAFIASCSSAPASYCLNYYSTDSGGSYQCGLTTSNLCGIPQHKYYCDSTHSIQCVGNQGWAFNSPGCGGATTQADCQTRWMGPYLGQKNQCQWDIAGGYCYLGTPCHY